MGGGKEGRERKGKDGEEEESEGGRGGKGLLQWWRNRKGAWPPLFKSTHWGPSLFACEKRLYTASGHVFVEIVAIE